MAEDEESELPAQLTALIISNAELGGSLPTSEDIHSQKESCGRFVSWQIRLTIRVRAFMQFVLADAEHDDGEPVKRHTLQ